MKWLLLLLFTLSAYPQSGSPFDPTFVPMRVVPSGGPDVWYDVEVVANGDSEDGTPASWLAWSDVTVAQAGTATKIRVYVKTYFGGGSNIKAALYTSGGSLIAGANGVGAVSASDSYVEITLGTPAAVTAATTYKIAWMPDTSNATIYRKASTGTVNLNFSATYGAQPVGTLPTADASPSFAYVVGVYVD